MAWGILTPMILHTGNLSVLVENMMAYTGVVAVAAGRKNE